MPTMVTEMIVPTVEIGQSVLERIGQTPMLRLPHIAADAPGVELVAKAEWFNPGGSVKDRPAWNMIRAAEQRGELRPGLTLLDATSGNTGIALAMIGAARGYPVRLCLPANASPERRRILGAYGAELVITDAAEGTDGAIRRARELAAAEPGRYFYVDQYSNPDNWRAHYLGTAEEIWAQTGGTVTHFVAGLGTTGTFVGVTRRLKERKPSIRCISLQPDGPFHGLEGWKHLPTAMVPAIYDPSLADENLGIATETAYAMVRRLAREEGLLVGVSAGAAVAGALQVARGAPAGSVVVTVLPDNADKYLSERFWEEF
ncbi:MAG: PLP-dependent cysteine synthase family protein [Terriglobales bacterium]